MDMDDSVDSLSTKNSHSVVGHVYSLSGKQRSWVVKARETMEGFTTTRRKPNKREEK